MRTPALLFTLLLLSGCDCSGEPDPGCTSASDCETGEVCVDGTCEADDRPDASTTEDGGDLFDAGPGARVIEGLRLEPASADLVSTEGSMPTQAFQAIVSWSDGTESPAVGPVFAIDTVSLGTLDVASGEFVANGFIGGAATVSVEVPVAGGDALTADASLTVTLEREVRGEGVTDEDVAAFGTATAVDDDARRAAVVYPLDGVVMPQNVYPADIQWTRSVDGDRFRVTLSKPSATVTAFLLHDPLMHWLADETGWRAVAQTEPGAEAVLTVDRLEAATGELVRGTPVRVTFARAALGGSVYYWEISTVGKIVRIDDGTATRVEFMPAPPAAPADGSRCIGCHSVSNSGRYLAGRLGGGNNYGGIFDLTRDLTADPAPAEWPVSTATPRWWFSSWSPDDTRLVVAQDAPALAFVDPATGAQVSVTGALPSGTYPAWSPDGATIAFVSEQNGWGDAPTVGNVWTLPVTGPDAVGTAARLHDATTLPGGTVDSYPTWSPDSAHIAFANGGGARSETVGVPVALYWMAPDGSDVTALARAASTGMDYQPNFSPFEQGGYYWLSFLSRRIYGNPQLGNTSSAENRRQQIWITAIRTDAAPGEDPSSVPYWLSGQNPGLANISAFWAPRACRPDGESCSVGSECCGGDCRPPAGGGDPVCSPPPPDRCRNAGETCSTTADCCPDMGLTCIANACVAGPG